MAFLKTHRKFKLHPKMLPLWLLSIAAVINIVQFNSIDNQANKNYKAIHQYETSKIIELGTSSNSVRSRWLPWLVLKDFAPNSTVFLPKGEYFDMSIGTVGKLYSYGGAKQVVMTRLSSTKLLEGVELEKHVVISIEDTVKDYPNYAIAISSKNEHNKLMPSNISGMSSIDELSAKRNTKFVLTEWDGPKKYFHPKKQGTPKSFYGVFIETSLLAEDIQKELSGYEN